MTNRARDAERVSLARLTGAIYLSYFVVAFGTMFLEGLAPKSIVTAGGVLGYTLYAIVSLLLYDLFRPVNKNLSLVAALLSLAGCVRGLIGTFHLPTYHVNALVFFGPYCVLLGILILRSTFLPHKLGALMVLAGFGWLIYLIPHFGKHLMIAAIALGVVAEGSLMLWLLAKGVNEQKWQKQARAAAKAAGKAS